MMRSSLLLVLLSVIVALSFGRRIPPTVNKKNTKVAGGRWGTPASVSLDMGLALEEDLAKDMESTKEDKTKKVKQVKAVKKAKLVNSPQPGPMPGPSLFGFPPVIGLEVE